MRGKSHLMVGVLSSVNMAICTGMPITPLGIACAGFFSVAADIDESNSSVLNRYISKKSTNTIHRIILYTTIIFIFYVNSKLFNNRYLAMIIALAFILLVEKKVTSGLVRTVILSLSFFLLAATMYLYRANISLTVIVFLIAVFPLLRHRTLTHSILIVVILAYLLRNVENTTWVKNIAFMSTVAYSSHLLGDIITVRGIPLFYPLSSRNFSIMRLKVGSIKCNMVEWIIIISLAAFFLFSVFNHGNLSILGQFQLN